MHKLFDLAALWEYLPLERRNPVDLVKIKGVTKRQKESIVLTPEQFRDIMSPVAAPRKHDRYSDGLPWSV